MALGTVFAAAVAALPTGQGQLAPSQPATSFQSTAEGRGRVRLDIALTFNGAYVADVAVAVAPDGSALVDVEALLRAIGPRVAPEAAADLRTRAAGRPEMLVADLDGGIVKLGFDFATLRLNATVAQASTAIARLSLSGDVQTYANVTPPEKFSFGLTASLFDRFIHSGPVAGRLGEQGLQGALRGFVNVGGIDGIYAAFDTGFRDTRNALRRSEDGERPRLTLFKDDVGRAIRYAAGSINPTTMGAYQVPLNLVGLSAERLYQTIQPYRNLRPAGRGGLVLENPSQVQILVNGVPQRTLQLGAGRYDLRDFPFLNGLNDVRIIVEDVTGRREAASLSFFSDTDLLDPGLTNFSLAAGYTTGDVNGFDSVGFRRNPLVTGYVQRGFSDRLTLGAAIQADQRNVLGTVQVVTATRLGLFGVQGALDFGGGDRPQLAAILSFRQQSFGRSGVANGLSVDATYQGARFTPMTSSFGFASTSSYVIDARYQTVISDAVFASFGAGYERGGGQRGGQYRLSASASRSFRLLTVNLSVDQQFGARGDTRIALSISRPIGRRTSVRARYQSFRNTSVVEVERVAYPSLDQYGYRAALSHSDDGLRFDGQGQYFGNRFQGNVRHSFADLPTGRSQVTDVALTTGVGYADGKLAWGREADRGFVILDKHRSLRQSEVRARSSTSLGVSASTGLLGAALVPLIRPYTRDSIAIDVKNLPAGYDIGAGQYDLQQGAANGYRFEIGSAAANTVVGRLLRPDGSAVSLLTGELRPLANSSGESVPFFTNRTGRMVAQRVSPGRYQLVINGTNNSIGDVVVTADANGLVDIGTITVKGSNP